MNNEKRNSAKSLKAIENIESSEEFLGALNLVRYATSEATFRSGR
jgi:hypothetical protein